MTELWLIRHGQTDWNLKGRYQGQADEPLNATGLAQAQILAASLARRSFRALYSSDLLRAYQTARIIADKLDLEVQVDTRLREINQGQWQGRTVDEIREAYNMARLPGSGRIDPAEARAPGGESVLEVSRRVAQAASDIARRHPTGAVLVVAHGLALATLYCQASGIDLADVYAHIADNSRAVVIQWPPK